MTGPRCLALGLALLAVACASTAPRPEGTSRLDEVLESWNVSSYALSQRAGASSWVALPVRVALEQEEALCYDVKRGAVQFEFVPNHGESCNLALLSLDQKCADIREQALQDDLLESVFSSVGADSGWSHEHDLPAGARALLVALKCDSVTAE